MTPPAGGKRDHPDPAVDDAEARRLVQRIYAGEPHLVGDLYQRYFGRLYGFASSLLGSAADAEDVTHHVFEDLLEALDSHELRDVISLRRWLFSVAHNRAIDYRRKHGRLELTGHLEIRERVAETLRRESREQPDHLSRVLGDSALVATLRRLPSRQREVLLLRYVGDFDLAEIAATIGGSEDSVKMVHNRALDSLRARLAPASSCEEPRRKRPLAMRQLAWNARRAQGHSFSSLTRP